MKKGFSKKSLAFLLAIAVVLTSLATSFAVVSALETNPVIWGGKEDVAEGFAGGSGTKADPYQISNGAELAYLLTYIQSDTDNAAPKTTGKYYALTADIYLNDVSDPDWQTKNPNSWYTFTNRFGGNLDGRGFTVYGLYFNDETKDYAGLIPVIDSWSNNVTVQNLVVSDAYLNAKFAGGITGRVYGYNNKTVSFINCTVTDSVTLTGANWSGGFVGFIQAAKSYYQLVNCSANATVSSGNKYFGYAATNLVTYDNGYRVADTYAGGTGTVEDPFQIATKEQLLKMILDDKTSGIYYKLTADINLNDISAENWKDFATQWIRPYFAFCGTFDGEGHTISGLYYNGTANCVGLFKEGNGATIKNLIFTNASVITSGYGASVIVGQNSGTVSFSEVYVDETCEVVSNYSSDADQNEAAGAFTGWGDGKVTIDNCASLATVTAPMYAGLFVGNVWSNAPVITNSFATGKFSGKYDLTDVCSNNYGTVSEVGTITLTADQMKGAAARENMPDLAWDSVWYTTKDGYPTLTAPEAPACTHANTTTTNTATYFNDGVETVYCEDCKTTVSETPVSAIKTAPVTFKSAVLDPATNKLTVKWEYSAALSADLVAADNNKALTVKFAFVGGKEYSAKLDTVDNFDGQIIIEGINADRFNTTLKVNLEFTIGEYTTTALNEVATYSVAVNTTVSNENQAKADAYTGLINAIANATEAVVEGAGTGSADFTAGASSVDIKAGTATFKFVATKEFFDTVKAKGTDNRTVKLVVTVDGEEHEVTINQLKTSIKVTIKGLSFEQMYGSVSAKLVITYSDDSSKNIDSKAVSFNFADGIDASENTVAVALEALLKN